MCYYSMKLHKYYNYVLSKEQPENRPRSSDFNKKIRPTNTVARRLIFLIWGFRTYPLLLRQKEIAKRSI